MEPTTMNRRALLGYFSSVGLGSTLLPGVLWSRVADQEAPEITDDTIVEAARVAGLEFTPEERASMIEGLQRNLGRYREVRAIPMDNSVAPPFYFNPVVPGMEVDREPGHFRPSDPPRVAPPANLQEVAFWPVGHLAELIRSRQVSSLDLTRMYLARLERHNPTINCVVTLTTDRALDRARRADAELAEGRYRGPLHGIPWGAKDIIAVAGYPTTWGSGAFRTQTLDQDASVVRRLDEAGAVLVAKLTTGELASGDQWFGGRTNNPWDPSEGSSGSSAGPAAATVGGLVAFGIGTETSGSILSPSVVCGASGLRPTFGRVSRHGVMTLSWTQDRVGPICRTVEDCALVLHAIGGPDGEDLSVQDIPFKWDPRIDVRRLRVGFLEAAFAGEDRKSPEWSANDRKALAALRELGIEPRPFVVPDFPANALGAMGAESSAAFEAFVRTGGTKELSRPNRGNGMRTSRLVPAVEYLQAQRARGLLMRALAEATSDLDVIFAPYMDMRTRGEGGEEAVRPSADFFRVANVSGYPAVAVPHGFTDAGVPTGITFVGRPFGEATVLALAKAWQDATGWHERHPAL